MQSNLIPKSPCEITTGSPEANDNDRTSEGKNPVGNWNFVAKLSSGQDEVLKVSTNLIHIIWGTCYLLYTVRACYYWFLS
jgi:hypothetical protein